MSLLLYNPFLLYFQNDDMVHIPLSRDGILLQHNSFRPLCDLSMILDYHLWGKNAWGYHFTNLILHLINSFFVFILSKKILKKYSTSIHATSIAFLTAVLFWVYMNHSEAVFWILGRSAMIGMLFFLPASIFYLSRDNKNHFILCILFLLPAWLSYESTYIIPVLFLLISYIDTKMKITRSKKEIFFVSLVWISFILTLCTRYYFTKNIFSEYEKGGLSNGLLALAGNYARLFMRSWIPPVKNATLFVSLSLVIVLIIAGCLFYNKKQRTLLMILLAFLAISLLPYTTLSIDTKGVESERFIYLPSLFNCLMIGIIISQFKMIEQAICTFIVCIANIIILNMHAIQYRFAGNVVRTTINAVNSLNGKQKLTGINIPQENAGALIFRSGFTDGINWLKNTGTVDSIFEYSQSKKDLPLQKNYKVVYTNDLNPIKDAVDTNTATNGEAFLFFSDTALYVITKK